MNAKLAMTAGADPSGKRLQWMGGCYSPRAISLRFLILAVLGMSMVTSLPLQARDIHYGAIRHAGLLECDRLHWRGRQEQSSACYQAILSGNVSLAVRGEAAWALNDLQLANRLFKEAVAAEPEDAGIRVRWGDLFADSHQDGEAMNLYREALGIDAANAFATLGAARLLVGGFDDAANSYLEPLLTDANRDDGARAGAFLLIARVALEAGNRADAKAALDTAEKLLASGDWPPLDLYALRAASDLLDNVTASEFTEKSLAYNPAYGGIYAIPAHFYVITRRYREAIDLYQKAVDVEPTLAAAHEELGVNLLRDNQMSRARKHLEIAYREDPFSPKAVNTLRLLDSFDNFRVINDPDTPEQGVLPIIFRLHKDEAAVVLPYATALARASIAEFTERYGFTLAEPVVIEMYPDHEDFAVRTAGMPGLGILGATFGYVVAMDSPSGRPPEQFQWGTTLWHEMAHVFTLEATGHLVPRWFSEGISVFEEWRSGPNPGVRIPMSVYNAMKDDRFLPVADLDEGFIRPSYEEQVIVSYMQAGLVCQYIDRRFGVAKLRDMLAAFRDGQQTGEAIEAVLGITPRTFDRDFANFVDKEHGAILDRLDHWAQSQQAIAEAIADEAWDRIAGLASDLIDIQPRYVETDSPYLALARAKEELGDRDAAIAALTSFWENGGYEPTSLKRLAEWLTESGQSERAIGVFTSANLVDPLDAELHGMFGDLLMDTGDAQGALREYDVLMALDPLDKASAWYRLASANQALGHSALAQQQLLLALEMAPNYRPAQRLLLQITRTAEGSAR